MYRSPRSPPLFSVYTDPIMLVFIPMRRQHLSLSASTWHLPPVLYILPAARHLPQQHIPCYDFLFVCVITPLPLFPLSVESPDNAPNFFSSVRESVVAALR